MKEVKRKVELDHLVLLRWRRVGKNIYRVNKRIRNIWLNPNSSLMKKLHGLLAEA